ncbi:MAG: hypothetical protein COA96_02545 [SAR86 cluster bacterium]|uniref:GlcNAc-PI de-N-acetylase n=1 Tax=SAR86 cluster bacterium TaxID=2030880 RepID=A0A2A5B8A2_9GAMM|nr:MAG: hypothetical protein COA96_02545 [SAR86 cluster bacterium]
MLNPEHSLIPYQVSAVPEGPWLVFAPHADDETYGMGGSLLKASDEGVATHLVVLTDGALGGDSENLTDIRKKEVQRAADVLGIASVQCWDEPDRGLNQSEKLLSKVVHTIEDLKPASVFFPGPLEIHPDHRAAAQLIWAALQSMANADKPRAYAYEISVQNPVNIFIDITSQRECKEQAMAAYASQNSENNYEELVLSLDKGRTFSLPTEVSHAEGFYHFSEADLGLSLREVTHRIIDLYF